tara:strand:- start:3060 stop:3563 length:504 start_codon:yes stop_codon:yes gene_type:complete
MKKIYIVDQIFDEEELKKVTQLALNLPYTHRSNDVGYYGNRCDLEINDTNVWIFDKLKKIFFPNENLKTDRFAFHMRSNTNIKKVNVHTDEHDMNILVYLQGEELLYNGTGFWTKENQDGSVDLNTYIGFKINRGIFFNGGEIKHADLQGLGPSSPRYALTLFLDRK